MRFRCFPALFILIGSVGYAAGGHWKVPSLVPYHPQTLCDTALTPAARRFFQEIGNQEANRQIILWNTLVYAVGKTGFEPLSGRPVRILNLASGAGDESYLLSAFFGSGRFLVPSDDGRVVSMDISRAEIEIAHSSQVHFLMNLPDGGDFVIPVRYFIGDATQPAVFQSLAPVDVLWIRHPAVTEDVVQNKKTWNTLVENGVGKLRPGGIVIMTFYTRDEGRFGASMLYRAGADLVMDAVPNPAIPYELRGATHELPKDHRDLFLSVGVKPFPN